MHMIIEAIKRKYESSNLKPPEFYVYFNDVVSNDFNTLFSSFPPNRGYEVAAVPGDFHRRLLPPSSIHFAYSSCSLHWLTEAPKATEGLKSLFWSGGEKEEVYESYLGQCERDLESFLKCRAVEMVEGGIMALLIAGVPDSWDPQREFTGASVAELLRASLLELAKKVKSTYFDFYLEHIVTFVHNNYSLRTNLIFTLRRSHIPVTHFTHILL